MIAAYNLADMRFPRTDPRMNGFFDNVDRMNALAERSPGFVWRLIVPKTEERRAGQVAGTTLTTLSVWESVEALGDYVFNTVHVQFYLRRAEWFEAITRQHMVLWTHVGPDWPDEAEAQARLARYEAEGPTDAAYGWEQVDTARWPRMGRHAEVPA